MVVDSRKLNEISVGDCYPLSNISEILDQLKKNWQRRSSTVAKTKTWEKNRLFSEPRNFKKRIRLHRVDKR